MFYICFFYLVDMSKMLDLLQDLRVKCDENCALPSY